MASEDKSPVKDLAEVTDKRKFNGHGLKDIDMDDVLEMYNSGCSTEEIGQKYGVTRQTIQNRLRKIKALKTDNSDGKKGWRMDKPERLYGGAIQSLEKWCTATDEEISQLMGNVVKWYELGKLAPVKTDEECAERIDAYFQYIIRTGEKPSLEKLALSLGVTINTVSHWKNGDFGSKARQAMINYAVQTLAAMDAELVNNNKIPQVTYDNMGLRAVMYVYNSSNFWELSVAS